MTQVKYNLQDTGKVGRLLWFWPGRGWQSCWTQPGQILVKKLLFRQLLYNCEIWWRCWDLKIVELGKFKNSLLGQHCYNGHLFCWENMWAEINGSFQQWGWVRRKLKRKCLQLIAHNPFFFYSFKSKNKNLTWISVQDPLLRSITSANPGLCSARGTTEMKYLKNCDAGDDQDNMMMEI